MKFSTLFTAPLALMLFAGCQKTNPIAVIPPAPLVNAGPSQTITLPVDSVWLNGIATDTASKITAYLWSEVSGPNVPVFAAEGSRYTEVRGLVAGTYVFQLMAVDSLGATGVDTISINVATHVLKTDTLRTLFAGSSVPYELTFLSNPASPAGYSTIEFLAEAWTINTTTVYGRTLFKFNLSGIPSGTAVQSAKLVLFSDRAPMNGDLINANSGPTNDFFIKRVTGSWDLANTNWNNLPAADTVGQVHVAQTSLSFLDLNVDVTQMVSNMINSGNNGFVMQLNTESIYNTRIFCSSTYSDPGKHPYLLVTY